MHACMHVCVCGCVCECVHVYVCLLAFLSEHGESDRDRIGKFVSWVLFLQKQNDFRCSKRQKIYFQKI